MWDMVEEREPSFEGYGRIRMNMVEKCYKNQNARKTRIIKGHINNTRVGRQKEIENVGKGKGERY